MANHTIRFVDAITDVVIEHLPLPIAFADHAGQVHARHLSDINHHPVVAQILRDDTWHTMLCVHAAAT